MRFADESSCFLSVCFLSVCCLAVTIFPYETSWFVSMKRFHETTIMRFADEFSSIFGLYEISLCDFMLLTAELKMMVREKGLMEYVEK